jgi:hypothetical protein
MNMAKRRPSPLATQPVAASPSSDLKEKYQRWMSAWAGLEPEGKKVLSSLQEVGVMARNGVRRQECEQGKIAILPTVPFMLYWYVESDKRLKHQFNFVEAYLKGKAKAPGFGLYSGSQVTSLIDELGDYTFEAGKTVVLKVDFEELWLTFPRLEHANRWKRALSAFLKMFNHPSNVQSPALSTEPSLPILPHSRTAALLNETLGLIFDINANDKSDESNLYLVWTSIKVTFLQSSGHMHEEYFMFDKSQGVLEVSCEEILSCIRDRLDAGNLAILSLYLQEISLLVYEKRKKEIQSEEFGWTFRDVNKPELVALWQSDFRHIMQQYARGDSANLQLLLSRRTSEAEKQRTSPPLQRIFTLCSLHNLSTKLALTDLAQYDRNSKAPTKQLPKPVAAIEVSPALLEDVPRSVPLRSMDSQRKWYKEACDCYLF